MQQPLAIAILGGVSLSMVFSLIGVPLLYVLLARAAARPWSRRMRLLVVEDEPTLARYLQQRAARSGVDRRPQRHASTTPGACCCSTPTIWSFSISACRSRRHRAAAPSARGGHRTRRCSFSRRVARSRTASPGSTPGPTTISPSPSPSASCWRASTHCAGAAQRRAGAAAGRRSRSSTCVRRQARRGDAAHRSDGARVQRARVSHAP